MARSLSARRAQDLFLRLAASWELDAALLERSSLCLAESKELLAKASALLSEPAGDRPSAGT
jgi:hypothetical protein